MSASPVAQPEPPLGLTSHEAVSSCETWSRSGPLNDAARNDESESWVDTARLYAVLWKREDYRERIFSTGSTIAIPALEHSDWTERYHSGSSENPDVARTFTPQWLTLTSRTESSSQLLFRSEFKEIIKHIDQSVRESGAILILGWHGIGKSTFMHLYLADLLLRGKRVIWFFPGNVSVKPCYFAFDGTESGGRVRQVLEGSLIAFMDSNPDFHGCFGLFDSTRDRSIPPSSMSDCTELLFAHTTSPTMDYKNVQEWTTRRNSIRWWMKPWTWPEIYVAARRDPVSESGDAGVRNAYIECDPSIQAVNTTQPPDQSMQFKRTVDDSIEEACSNLDLLENALYLAIGDTEKDAESGFDPSIRAVRELPSAIFLPVPQYDDRSIVHVYAPSEMIASSLSLKVRSLEAHKKRLFMDQIAKIPNAQPFYGHIFECHVLEWLEKCHSSTNIHITILPGAHSGSIASSSAIIPWPTNITTHHFRYLSDRDVQSLLEDDKDLFLVPKSRSQATFDAVARIGTQVYILQATIQRHHEVKIEGLQDIHHRFNDKSSLPYHMIFVIPQGRGYSMHTRQNVIAGTGYARKVEAQLMTEAASGTLEPESSTEAGGSSSGTVLSLGDKGLIVPARKRQKMSPGDLKTAEQTAKRAAKEDVAEAVARWNKEENMVQYVWHFDI